MKFNKTLEKLVFFFFLSVVVVIVTNQRRGRAARGLFVRATGSFSPQASPRLVERVKGRAGVRSPRRKRTLKQQTKKIREQEVVRPAPLEAPAANQQRPSRILLVLQIKQ